MPKVLIDLGPVIDAAPGPELMREASPVQALTLEEEVASLPDTPPPPMAAPSPPAAVLEAVPAPAVLASLAVPAPVEDTAGVPDQRLAGIRSAEIDTGAGAVPAPELLATPGSGPSIMLDPNLVAEMDAFELANTAATPPPALTAPAPAKPAPAAHAAPGAVVSFVKGGAHPAPSGGPTLNNAPTVPLSPVAAAHPTASAAPTAPAAGSPGNAQSPPRSPTPPPGEPQAGRRASGEFNAREADFFARESDLYHHEPAESFDDLDPVTREPRRRS
jgi:hypothetical protein